MFLNGTTGTGNPTALKPTTGEEEGQRWPARPPHKIHLVHLPDLKYFKDKPISRCPKSHQNSQQGRHPHEIPSEHRAFMSLECCSWNLVHDPPLEPLHVTLGSQRNTDLVSASCTSLFTREPRKWCLFYLAKQQTDATCEKNENAIRLSACRIFMSDFLQSLFLSVPPLSFVTVCPPHLLSLGALWLICASLLHHFAAQFGLFCPTVGTDSDFCLHPHRWDISFSFTWPKGSSVFSATSARRYFFMFMFSNTLGGRPFSKPRN